MRKHKKKTRQGHTLNTMYGGLKLWAHFQGKPKRRSSRNLNDESKPFAVATIRSSKSTNPVPRTIPWKAVALDATRKVSKLYIYISYYSTCFVYAAFYHLFSLFQRTFILFLFQPFFWEKMHLGALADLKHYWGRNMFTQSFRAVRFNYLKDSRIMGSIEFTIASFQIL